MGNVVAAVTHCHALSCASSYPPFWLHGQKSSNKTTVQPPIMLEIFCISPMTVCKMRGSVESGHGSRYPHQDKQECLVQFYNTCPTLAQHLTHSQSYILQVVDFLSPQLLCLPACSEVSSLQFQYHKLLCLPAHSEIPCCVCLFLTQYTTIWFSTSASENQIYFCILYLFSEKKYWFQVWTQFRFRFRFSKLMQVQFQVQDERSKN